MSSISIVVHSVSCTLVVIRVLATVANLQRTVVTLAVVSVVVLVVYIVLAAVSFPIFPEAHIMKPPKACACGCSITLTLAACALNSAITKSTSGLLSQLTSLTQNS